MYTYTVSLSYRSSQRHSRNGSKKFSSKFPYFTFSGVHVPSTFRIWRQQYASDADCYEFEWRECRSEWSECHFFRSMNFDTHSCVVISHCCVYSKPSGELVGHKTGKVLVGSSSHSQCICRRRPCRPQLRLQHWRASPIWAPPRTRFIHTNSISAFHRMCLCWFVVVVPVDVWCRCSLPPALFPFHFFLF